MRKSRRIVLFLTLSSSRIEDVSQNCCVFDVAKEEVSQNSFVFKLDKKINRQTEREIDR